MNRVKILIISAIIPIALFASGCKKGDANPPGLFPDAPKDIGKMVLIPGGEFTMGSDDGESDQRPAHPAIVAAFFIDKYEVTTEQYLRCSKDSLCSKATQNDGFNGKEQPIVGVDWEQASAYCAWMDKRLPTEAEWEKAARGVGRNVYPWGDEIDCSKANYDLCSKGRTVLVGSFPTGGSPFNVMDMAGNVAEWTSDWYADDYYAESPFSNPAGPEIGTTKVVRGGSWNDGSNALRTFARDFVNPAERSNKVGFRCARNASSE